MRLLLVLVTFGIVGFVSSDESVGEALSINRDSDDDQAFQRWVRQATQVCVNEHNAVRRQNGKPAFQYDSRLEQASARHNQVMTSQNCFSHQCNGEAPFGDRISQTGYKWRSAAENIFAGGATCQEALKAWMNSPGHKANILSDNRNIGCAVQSCNSGCTYKYYWTCDFASPM